MSSHMFGSKYAAAEAMKKLYEDSDLDESETKDCDLDKFEAE